MINLLPPQYKQDLKKEEIFHIVLILGTISLIFFVSLALILLIIEIYLKAEVKSLNLLNNTKSISPELTQADQFREKVTKNFQNISKLKSFYKDKSDVTEILGTIFRAIPNEISLTSLYWQKETGIVTISGFAPNREALFELRNNLQAEKRFSDIKFPPQNFIKQTDIDFQSTFKINEH